MPAATYDAVRPIGLESPTQGGTQAYVTPREIDTREDALAAAGYYINGPTVAAADKQVLVDRAKGSHLRLTDPQASQLLSNIVGGSVTGSNPHASLADFTHFLGAPAEGWASGAHRVLGFSGPLVTSETWFTSTAMTKRIFFSLHQYYADSPLIGRTVSVLFAPNGTDALRTLVQTYGYLGPVCISETRTWS